MVFFGGLKERLRKWKLAGREPAEVFSRYYRTNKWGDAESRSGKGSNLAATAHLRQALPELVAELGVQSFLDLPCGDYFWMAQTELGVAQYTGGDIVPDLIAQNRARYGREGVAFEVIDLIEGPVPRHDMVFVRDALVHLSTDHIRAALANIRASGSDWLLTSCFLDTATNAEIATGQWRPIDLTRLPFDLPQPDRWVSEGGLSVKGQWPDKVLGLWRVSELPG